MEQLSNTATVKLILFAILSIPVVIISWRTLFHTGSHGFYRFLSWECIIWLFVSIYRDWFADPFSIRQIISWIFLLASAFFVIAGVLRMKRSGKQRAERDDKKLYRFERTSELIDTGIFKYIRHPLYSSLLFLTWGIYLKNMTVFLLLFAVLSSIFLMVTARFDEKECIQYFGEKYREYMRRSKRFIPFLW